MQSSCSFTGLVFYQNNDNMESLPNNLICVKINSPIHQASEKLTNFPGHSTRTSSKREERMGRKGKTALEEGRGWEVSKIPRLQTSTDVPVSGCSKPVYALFKNLRKRDVSLLRSTKHEMASRSMDKLCSLKYLKQR